MRVLVTGSRDFKNDKIVDRVLSMVEIDVLIQGCAKGLDTLAWEWAKSKNIPTIDCYADWKKYGLKAGPIRNTRMLFHNPEICISFPGGTGTKDMTTKALKAGIIVWKVAPDGEISVLQDNSSKLF